MHLPLEARASAIFNKNIAFLGMGLHSCFKAYSNIKAGAKEVQVAPILLTIHITNIQLNYYFFYQ